MRPTPIICCGAVLRCTVMQQRAAAHQSLMCTAAAALQVLRQYTNAAASLTSEILAFTSKFAIQVGFKVFELGRAAAGVGRQGDKGGNLCV